MLARVCPSLFDCGEPRPPTAIQSQREACFARTVLGDHSSMSLARFGPGCPGIMDW